MYYEIDRKTGTNFILLLQRSRNEPSCNTPTITENTVLSLINLSILFSAFF